MKVKDEYGEKVEGFYLVGFFDKGRQPKCDIIDYKPFTNDVDGYPVAKVFHYFRRNVWPKEWEFMGNVKIKDINKDKGLRKELNRIFRGWCKEHKRKEVDIFEEKKVIENDICKIPKN